MKRGELWTVSGGPGVAGKPRPALIVQDDSYNLSPAVAVCALTTQTGLTAFTRPEITPSVQNGLQVASQIMVDRIITIPRTRLGKRIGILAEDDLSRVDQALLVFLGLTE